MTEDVPVLSANQPRALVLDGVRYVVRALTYGEHAAMQVARAAQPVPSAELINDALRQAAEREGRADLAEAITAHEEAEDALSALYAARPPALDDAGLVAWSVENEPEIRAQQRALLAAGRRRRVAIERFGAAPEVAELRTAAAAAMRAATAELLCIGVVSIDGAPAALDAAAVGELPSAHVTALAQAISALLSPGQDAAKN